MMLSRHNSEVPPNVAAVSLAPQAITQLVCNGGTDTYMTSDLHYSNLYIDVSLYTSMTPSRGSTAPIADASSREVWQGLEQLTSLIFAKALPKQLGRQVLTGSVLAALTGAYVDAINGGAVPTITTAWQVGVPSAG